MPTQKHFQIHRLVLQQGWVSILIASLMLLVPALGPHVGAAGPAALVKDINPGPADALDLHNRLPLATARGRLFFTADDGIHGEELWTSDGTAAGTTLLANIRATGYSSILFLTNVNDTIFFGADDGVHGYELWKSDGTVDGTRAVADIFPGQSSSYAELLTNVNGTIFFRALDPAGWGLWKSDGTREGTVLVKRHTLPITNLASSERLLFYTSDEGADGFGNGLWSSDGTPGGTQLLKTFPPVQRPSPNSPPIPSVSSFTEGNGQMFFVAYTAGRGFELWKSDGTAAGTKLVSDTGPTMTYGDQWYFKNVNETLFMLVDHGQQSTSLWRSDGSADGTKLVRTFAPGTSAGDVTYFNTIQNLNGTLLFALYPAGTPPTGWRLGELWKSDGTTAGTLLISDQIYHGFGATVACGKLYFNGRAAEPSVNPQDTELWQSDGTTAGTTQVQDIAPGLASSDPRSLTAIGRQLFFSANDGTSGRELWVLPIEHTATTGPTPSIPLPHQIFMPHTQIDTSC